MRTGQSVVIGPDGRPVVAYNGKLSVARCDNFTCTDGQTTLSHVDPARFVSWTSIATGAYSLPVISYFESTNPPPQLKFVHCGSEGC